MTPTENSPIMEIYLKEYESLKHEQTQRLGFRDNLIYANLIAMTGIVSISASGVIKILVLLLLPFTCVVLGWTYLVNDEKISAIGRYIRYALSDKIREMLNDGDAAILGWETAHRSDQRRISRKIIQLIVDELVFVLPGFVAILLCWINAPAILASLKWVAVVEAILLIVLGLQIFFYADLYKGR